MTPHRWSVATILAGLIAAVASGRRKLALIKYPQRSAHGDVVDDYHGTKVADPFRWLEDDVRKSDEVKQWVEAENAVTFAYLEKIPQREAIKKRLTELWNYEKYYRPIQSSRTLLLLEKRRSTEPVGPVHEGSAGRRAACVARPKPLVQGRHGGIERSGGQRRRQVPGLRRRRGRLGLEDLEGSQCVRRQAARR